MDDVQLRQPFAFLAHRLFPFFQDRPTRSPFKRYTPKRGRNRLCHSPPMVKAVGTENHVVERAYSDMLLTCTTSQLGLIFGLPPSILPILGCAHTPLKFLPGGSPPAGPL